VLRGRGSEFEQELPFAVFRDALDVHLARVPSDRLERLVVGTLAELAQIFPGLAEYGYALETRLQSERWRVQHAVRTLLEELSRDGPVALILDDVHWADEASRELIAHLLRRPPIPGVLLTLVYREVIVPELASALTAARHEGGLQQIELGPLTESDAGRLLGDDFPPEMLTMLHGESGGNPFYLLELARAYRSGATEPAARTPDAGDVAVPEGVQAAIAAELRALTRDGRSFLQAAAVIGYAFDPRLAAEVAEMPEDRALAATDEVLARGLAREATDSTDVVFRHPIVHKAVYESGGHGWRIGAHARAARALEARGAQLPARAHHVERSAAIGDQGAVATLAAAGAEVGARAPATAARWYSSALRLLPEQGRVDQRMGLLLLLATSLLAAGRLTESRNALEQALQCTPADRPETRARVLGFISGLEHMRGRHNEARQLLTSALATAPEDSAQYAALEVELAIGHWYVGEAEQLVRRADAAAARAAALQRSPLQAEAVALVALGEASRGRVQRAAERLAEAQALVATLSEEDLTRHVRVLLFLGHGGFRIEHFAAAAEWLGQGVRIARSSGQDFWFVTLTSGIVFPYASLGRLEDAMWNVDTAHRAALTLSNDQALLWASAMGCWVAKLRGDLPAAVRFGAEAVAAARRAPSAIFTWLAYCHHAAALIAAGEVQRGVALILGLVGGPELSLIEPSQRSTWFCELADAELGQGDLAAAERWVERAEATAADLPGRKGMVLRARAALLLARQESERAAELATAGAELLGDADQRLDAARAEVLGGRALLAAGRRDAAAARLEGAHSSLTECGAVMFADEAAQLLRQLGRRPPRRRATQLGREAVEALSPRELEVARLVGLGLTNREIGERLFVSTKTVETHLSRVFAKLGVSSRVGVATIMERTPAPPGHT
jgi:DNA-binding NarL/FixJ family response regulator